MMDFDGENKQRLAKVSVKATKGFKSCVLAFFEESFVIVFINKKKEKELNKELKKNFKEQKVSLLDRNQARKDYWDNFAERYAYIDKEELLYLSQDNEEVEYESILKMSITPYRKNVRKGGEVSDELGQISLKGEQMKHHFNHYYFSDNPKYMFLKEFLQQKDII